MKKIYTLLFTLITVLFLQACDPNALKIYLPKEYIDDSVVEAFEKEYGVKVEIYQFDSNEIALTQARINRYDLIIPSDYAIEEFKAEGMIKPIDWDKIELKKDEFAESLQTILDELKANGFDLLEYAVPYFWGSIGLIYNHNKPEVEEKVLSQGWAVLGDHSITKMIYDSPRDAYMAALFANETPIKMSHATENDIKAATDWLIAAKGPNTVVESDEILDKAAGNAVPYDVAMVYSGDATYILQDNENYTFYIPEWSNVWIDGMVIPTNSRNEDLAYDFINFVNSYEQSLANATYIGYSPVRQDVLNTLLEDEEFVFDERIEYAFNVDVTLFSYEVYRYDNKLKGWIDDNYDLFLLK